MPDKTCETCKYFIQHYRRVKRNYLPVYCGHCMEPRLKTRRGDTPACERYQPRE